MNDLCNDISSEALKLIRRFEGYARRLAEERIRRLRRTIGVPVAVELRRPAYWALARGFDPYLVRATAPRIAHSIELSVRRLSYLPRNPVIYVVPKAGGGTREVSVFQVADNAVSLKAFGTLMEKNRPLLSSRAYAYRDDVTAQNAIEYLYSELRSTSRTFIAEYDFSKYFDNISHDYLWRILRDRRFAISPQERNIIQGFMAAPGQSSTTYIETGGRRRGRGVPQGTSVSLFLANVAAWELDRALERLGVSFVRYADDTLIWSVDYNQICRAVDVLYELSVHIGAPVNLTKSKGIRLLVREGAAAEMQSATYVEYLGHEISHDHVSIKQGFVRKVKRHINALLYHNLIRDPKLRTQRGDRLADVDKDYATFVSQLRRYLYGGLSERGLRGMQSDGGGARRFNGVMAFFPLVDNEKQLRKLDRWLAYQVYAALKKRATLIGTSIAHEAAPHGRNSREVVRYIHEKRDFRDESIDLRLPSFRRIARVIRKTAKTHGVGRVARALSYEDIRR
jgi:hypothetical protein